MDRINGSNVAPDLHGAGKDGWRDGNKALGIPATVVTAEFLNGLQEEVANVIEGQGITLDVGDKTQLKKAIERMIKGGDYKDSVRVASTVAINLAAPGANIDGVVMVAGNRFLEKDNATLANRGIYIWNGAAVAATRADDADAGAEFNSGAIIPVEEGAINGNTNWQLITDGTITIGVTNLTFQAVGTASDASQTAKGIVELATDAETQAGTDTSRAITPSGLRAGVNASGSAPIYACRAWVNFNGTGTVAIKASGNVSSITDDAAGIHTVNFNTAMPDVNYATVVTGTKQGGPTTESGGVKANQGSNPDLKSTTQVKILFNDANGNKDLADISVSIFR